MTNNTSLSLLLKSLCLDSKWSYAVFWKRKRERDVTLKYEDGYFHDASEKAEDTLHEGFLPSNSGWSREVQDRYSASYPIKGVFESMLYRQYSLGEGIVGKVASTQRHYWVFGGELDLKFLPEYDADWQLQFAAGIKTILLVPIAVYGVVQLGSLDMVMEDPMVVGGIKDIFCNLFQNLATSNMLESSFERPITLSPIGGSFLGNSSTSDSDLLNPTQSQQLLNVDPDMLSFSMLDDFLLSQDFMNQFFDTDITHHPEETIVMKMTHNNLLFDPVEEPCLPDPSRSIIDNEIYLTENETKFRRHPNSANCRSNPEQFSSHVKGEVPDYSDLSHVKDMISQETENTVEASSMMPCRFFTSVDLELHKALGPKPLEENGNYFLNAATAKSELISSTTFQTSWSEILEQSFDGANACSVKEFDGHMLDAVVSSLHSPSVDEFESAVVTSYNNYEKFIVSPPANSKTEFSVSDLEESLLNKQSQGFMVSATSSLKTTCMSNDEESKSSMASRSNSRKLSEFNRRRGKSGTSHKPRPRDRQLIQDRIKELRELIPNGSKCSIDELLYKTVRHMLFLKSVSNQAEKLSQTAFSKILGEDWSSFKSGTKSQEDYPLIVENLDQPGQILVEMLCKDYGLFLDIAYIFRRLELAILKGVLESRSDVLWAHFIIEVPRGFQKTQIMWPLMQLLQQNSTTLKHKL